MISTPATARIQPGRAFGMTELAPVLPLRGCMLCQHGHGPEHARRCSHPHAPDAPVEQVRRAGGACGPEAELLDFAGLRA